MLKKSKKGVKKFIIILSLGLGRFGKGQLLSAVKWRACLARPPVAMAMATIRSQTIAAPAALEPSTKNAANERQRKLLAWQHHAEGRAHQRLQRRSRLIWKENMLLLDNKWLLVT